MQLFLMVTLAHKKKKIAQGFPQRGSNLEDFFLMMVKRLSLSQMRRFTFSST